ncbi:hypothetical protein BKA57DRAFT_435781 [Linnemannia elongata]|nr:hypothetical protein BKA57DRAFT_435781 [Linnemannia elongata]
MFAKALTRRMGNESAVFVNCANPERLIGQRWSRVGWKGCAHSMVVYPVERGSLTPLYLRTSPEVENKKMTERCIGPIANEIEPYRNYARDEEVQEELWAYSEKLANDKPNA